MKLCAVPSCRKDSANYPRLTFFSLPRDQSARADWLDAIGVKHNELSQNIKVCETHFKSKDFCAGRRQLKVHAVPVLNLGTGGIKRDPLNSDDSDNEDEVLLREIEKLTEAEAMMDRTKNQKEQSTEEKPQEEEEQVTGRRPSRRAAQVAAKRIYNTCHSYNFTPDNEDDDPEVVSTSPTKLTTATPRPKSTPRSAPRQRRNYQAIKVPPPNIDLVMECHEELLSTVQAEALLQAQLQYNMVMKTLRNMKASNVRIILQAADEPAPITSDDEDDKSNIDTSSDSKPSNIVLQTIKKEEPVYPMELSTNVPSPAPILS